MSDLHGLRRTLKEGGWRCRGADAADPAETIDDSLFVSKTGMTFWEGLMAMLEGISAGNLAYVEQYFQPRGGPPLVRTLPEQDLALEVPIGGIAPKMQR